MGSEVTKNWLLYECKYFCFSKIDRRFYPILAPSKKIESMKRNLLSSIITLTLFANMANAQWAAVGGTLPATVLSISFHDYNIYAGGRFSSPNLLGKFWAGSWTTVGAGLNGGTEVFATVDYNGQLYVGGNFLSAASLGGTSAYLARWNNASSTWSTVANGANQAVKAFAKFGDDLYVGGKFSAVNNTSGQVSGTSCIAKWNSNTNLWTAVGTGIGGSVPEVNAIVTMGTDIYAAGSFTTAGGSPVTNVAKWNGTAWSAVGTTLTTTVNSLAVFNNTLYAGGAFGVKQWTGSAWVDLGTGVTGSNKSVLAMISYNGALTIGGYFSGAGGVPGTANIARWSGSTWYSMNPLLNADVDAFHINPATAITLYIGGTFTAGTGGSYSRVAKYTTAVSVDEEAIPSSDIRIYPNPATDKFSISLDYELKSNHPKMIVYNMLGKQVKEQSIVKNQPLDINCKEFDSGIYFIKVIDGNRTFTQKLIVE
jgi:hypothetical protein